MEKKRSPTEITQSCTDDAIVCSNPGTVSLGARFSVNNDPHADGVRRHATGCMTNEKAYWKSSGEVAGL
jgi:hypothetical protein